MDENCGFDEDWFGEEFNVLEFSMLETTFIDVRGTEEDTQLLFGTRDTLSLMITIGPFGGSVTLLVFGLCVELENNSVVCNGC